MTTSSILGQFDLCSDQSTFPDLLNGYYHPVDARIHLFGDSTRWAMVAELLGYCPVPATSPTSCTGSATA